MIKVCIILLCAAASTLAVTQEQLAQYVAAQQTAGQKPRPQAVAVVGPRARPQYALQPQPAEEELSDEAYQQAYQAAYQQAAAAYQQPQASSYKSFSSSSGSPKAAPAAYQPQPLYYRPAPAPQYAQYAAKPRPAAGPAKQPEEDYDPSPAYQFSFDVKDDEFTNYQNRNEQREGDKISGSYSVVDSDGYIRTVKYTADPKEGFKADVTREPTDIRVKIPQPPSALPQQYQQIPQTYVRKQQTQQYLEASSPAVAAPQYRPQYAAPQFAPQYLKASPAPSAGLGSYSGPHRLAAPKAPKASAIGYAQQPTASPILYQAYQQ